MNLEQSYSRDTFILFLKTFISGFIKDIRRVNTSGLQITKEAYYLGESHELNLSVFELTHSSSTDARIALASEGFRVLKSSAAYRALVVYRTDNEEDWRLSLMTATPGINQEGRIRQVFSNPRRLSYLLGPHAKINTPTKYLIKNGAVKNFEDLQSRFSLEVVNKEFYTEISKLFTQLIGGTISIGKNKIDSEPLIKLPSIVDRSQTALDFGVRLIGRIIFCWFLREKKSDKGNPLMPKELLSLDAIKNNTDYYHKILEPIFFEVLNKPKIIRRVEYTNKLLSLVPYLNGGLFSPQEEDYYKRLSGDLQSHFHNILVIPDEWLIKLFNVLETYNFTIDENTSFDKELSIDPEMLGRIFENLLAEINPITGASARKSTGSYYTPRVIVDYMIDESLFLYLNNQTNMDAKKLRAILSYDLNDDIEYPLNDDEKQRVVDALERVKILDPACGSGAFPIGILQKIVFVLQQIDPEGKLWFKNQIKKTSPEVKRVIEREFNNKNFDYIRKLGVIRENIYGVDIQPIATEISRLRCFLTLVVDERIQEELENRGIEPLPNLDFKFVTANTLIELPGGSSNSQIGLFEDEMGIKELRELRDMFFNASGSEREQLKLQFVQVQKKMFQKLIAENIRGHADLTAKLSNWDPFGHKSVPWFDSEWMFGIKDGFDVVIANPPYITVSLGKGQKNFTSEEANNLNLIYSDVKEYKNNTFVYFISLAIKLLHNNGHFNYIVPDVLLYNKNFSKIRNYILDKTKIEIIVDIKDRVFESAEIGGNCILLSLKHATKDKEYLIKTTVVKDLKDFDIVRYDQIQVNTYRKTKYNKFYLEKVKTDLLIKLDKDSTQLGNLAQFYNGIKTGDNNKFLSTEKFDEMCKKVYRGRDINKYYLNVPTTYVLFDKSKLWSNYNEDLLGKTPKILIRQTGDALIAAIEEQGCYHMDTTHSVFDTKINIIFLLCLLNSKLLDWWHKTYTSEEGRAFAEVKIATLKEIPIKYCDEKVQKKYVDIGRSISEITKSEDYSKNKDKQEKVKDYIKQIDQMVYELYDLTTKEIEIVENLNEDTV
jgi:hypothetical protein